MSSQPSPPPRRSFNLDAWRPSAKALWLVLAAFVIGLVLFALVWSGDRDSDDFYRGEGTPPTSVPRAYDPLPTPLPARDREASGLDAERRETAAAAQEQEREQPRIVEPAAPSMPPTADTVPPPTAGAMTQPRPVSTPSPRYPTRALRRGESGTVMVRAEIGPDGVPTSVSAAESSGSRVLDRAAVDAVRRWRFQPATVDGRPTVGTVVVPIAFEPGR